MKKLTMTILGLGLLTTGAFASQDAFSSFYPEKENDTPEYLISHEDIGVGHQTLVSSVSTQRGNAFYPEKENDSPDYLADFSNDDKQQSVIAYEVGKSSLKACTFATFYPEKDTDSPRAIITC